MNLSNNRGTSGDREKGKVKFKNARLSKSPDPEQKLNVKSDPDPKE
jgi:hypothetical protein